MNKNYLCPVCAATSDFFSRKDDYDFYLCPACRLIFVRPLPTKKFLASRIYTGGYQGNKSADLANIKPSDHFKKIINYLKSRTAGRLLDVGAANGEFLFLARAAGFVPTGVELNERNATIANRHDLNVKTSGLIEANFPNQSFEAVFLGDVIEHVTDPAGLFQELRRIITPRGYLVVSTPDLNSFWARISHLIARGFKLPWPVLEPPYHLHQFNDDNLNRLANRFGFRLERKWYRRPPTFRYEFGATHLLGRFKRQSNLVNLTALLLGLGLYGMAYALDIIIGPIKRSDFGLVAIYQKNA